MATITINVPNGIASRVQDAIATAQNGYTGFEADNTTPQTKLTFCKNFVIKFLKEEVKKYEGNIAQVNAINSTFVDVETNIILT